VYIPSQILVKTFILWSIKTYTDLPQGHPE
jgi:hypothetical protein